VQERRKCRSAYKKNRKVFKNKPRGLGPKNPGVSGLEKLRGPRGGIANQDVGESRTLTEFIEGGRGM
jgi:hypothetical protein